MTGFDQRRHEAQDMHVEVNHDATGVSADDSLLLQLRNRKIGSRESFAVWKSLREKKPRVKKIRVEKPLTPCRICGEVLVKKFYCSDACKQVAYRNRINTPVALKHKEEKMAAKNERRRRRDAYKSIGLDRYSGPDRKEVPLFMTPSEAWVRDITNVLEIVSEKITGEKS